MPDGVDALFQERFLTANINGLVLVNLADYYAPLDSVVKNDPKAAPGLKHFKDNCVYCHSLKGRGNKGGSLLDKFDFASERNEKFQESIYGISS